MATGEDEEFRWEDEEDKNADWRGGDVHPFKEPEFDTGLKGPWKDDMKYNPNKNEPGSKPSSIPLCEKEGIGRIGDNEVSPTESILNESANIVVRRLLTKGFNLLPNKTLELNLDGEDFALMSKDLGGQVYRRFEMKRAYLLRYSDKFSDVLSEIYGVPLSEMEFGRPILNQEVISGDRNLAILERTGAYSYSIKFVKLR